jgi:hypothetical protein
VPGAFVFERPNETFLVVLGYAESYVQFVWVACAWQLVFERQSESFLVVLGCAESCFQFFRAVCA